MALFPLTGCPKPFASAKNEGASDIVVDHSQEKRSVLLALFLSHF